MSKKIIGVTVGTQLPKPNFKQTDPTKGDYIRNKPDFEGLKAQVENIQKNAYDDTEVRGLISDNASDITALEGLVGDKKVSEQITAAIANKSDSGHSHDDKYYTESEVDSKLSGKSDTGHTHSAYVNQNAFSNVVVGSTTIAADSTTDTLTLVAGSNVTLTPDASGDKITIAAKDTTYTHPTSGVTAGIYKSVTVNAQGHVTAGSNPTTLSGYGITDAATKAEFKTVSDLVGDTKVSTQIGNAIANKSDVGHDHDTDYDAKGAADTALASAKTYADEIKNDLLNGAGTAYDTLKELGDLIDENQDAIDALETVAASKADASALTSHTGNKSNPHGVTAAQVGAVPTSRTVNGKALSTNITLSASDVGADASGAANTALTNAKAYTNAEITEWVGDKTVSEQIFTAIAGKSDTDHAHDGRYYTESEIDTKLSGKSDTGHTHDDRYYTESEINTKLSGKSDTSHNHDTAYAAKSHGNHVPATETANNAKFLRNDNTWQTVTPANIGAAASSHGTHVSYSTTAPVMDGTASVGSASTVARSDHKHPTDTSRASASDLTALQGLVGDTKVSTQITNAIGKITHPVTSVNNKTGAVSLGASDVGAVPTSRTVNGKSLSSNITLSASDVGAAAKSHGNHVPATETANNAKFLRNDNTWQTVTPANIGAAAASHGTHVTFATTAPKAAGTASVGTATTVSRSDHVHPAQTNISGNAATATKATQDASGNVITSTYATKTALNEISTLVGDTKVSTQIETAVSSALDNVVYVSEENQESAVVPLNADTLGGQLPEYYINTIDTKITDKIIYGNGKNLLKNTANSNTVSGVTFTVNDDGSVGVSGTASTTIYFHINTFTCLAGKTYRLTGCPSGGSINGYYLYYKYTDTAYANDISNGINFTPSADITNAVIISVKSGTTVNTTFYPMLRFASETDDNYEPYYEGLKKITDNGAYLLWENASPNSTFAAQTVYLDLSAYNNFFILEFRENISSAICTYCFGYNNNVNIRAMINYNYRNTRDFAIANTAITFNDAYSAYLSNTMVVDNDKLIPIKVWGLKYGG